MRKSGILMHISSLPSQYGIGKLGIEAFRFVDFLDECQVGLWQILPLSPTSYGDSPYQSFSAFAGNPYFIDFELLENDGLLHRTEYSNIQWEKSSDTIDYEFLYNNVYEVLRKAYSRFTPAQEYKLFEMISRDWLDDYALFMSLKFHYNGAAWYEWPKNIAMYENEAVDYAKNSLLMKLNFTNSFSSVFTDNGSN